jgi:hypothetical protein
MLIPPCHPVKGGLRLLNIYIKLFTSVNAVDVKWLYKNDSLK